MTTPVRCICGTPRPPTVHRRGTRSHLMVMECPACKTRTPVTRPELLGIAWAVHQAYLRSRQQKEQSCPPNR